jgi:hypothetical protein
MKYKILLAAVIFPFLAKSQTEEKDLQLGFTLSPTLSWLTNGGDALVSEGSKAGFSYGILADFGFAKNYYFSTAFTLTSLNSEAKRTDKSIDNFHLQYIEVPLTLKLKSNPSGIGRFYGQFGLGTGIKVSAKKDITTASGATSKDVSLSSDTNIFRLGLIAGAGAEWSIGKNLSGLTGVTFNNGFTKTFSDVDSRNPFITLQLGIFF